MRQAGDVGLLGKSRAITALKEEVLRVAQSDAKVLITGETGTGKEVVARSINAASGRANLPLVTVNCAGIPETLLESELFGHVKGSFTGAYRDKPGKLEIADNGTIFLDEIGEMTPRMQGLLLRFLESGEIQKVGTERAASITNVRVIAATNRNLRDLIAQGQFREDLYYRLNVIHLIVPPLRERREDIPILIDHFLQRFTQPSGNGHGNGNGGNGHRFTVTVHGICPDAVAALCQYSWPGNVRELENAIERLVVTCQKEIITADEIAPEIRMPLPTGAGGRPRYERRRSVVDDLYKKLVNEHESFWTAVYPQYMKHEITGANMRELVRKGLEEARGNYKIVLRLFNIEPRDYKRFLNFLRKHDCQLPFKDFR
jgi:two-component system, NtrC family, response regulator HydG